MTENELDEVIAAEASALAAKPYEDGLLDGAANAIGMLHECGHPEMADALLKALQGDREILAHMTSGAADAPQKPSPMQMFEEPT